LTFEVPYREEDVDLTRRKSHRMRRTAAPKSKVSMEQMEALAGQLSGKSEVLERLQEEAGERSAEGNVAG
jgi:hypothetical protein